MNKRNKLMRRLAVAGVSGLLGAGILLAKSARLDAQGTTSTSQPQSACDPC